jgi:hypothetical protein
MKRHGFEPQNHRLINLNSLNIMIRQVKTKINKLKEPLEINL